MVKIKANIKSCILRGGAQNIVKKYVLYSNNIVYIAETLTYYWSQLEELHIERGEISQKYYTESVNPRPNRTFRLFCLFFILEIVVCSSIGILLWYSFMMF